MSKRILIISHNPLSQTNNMGKTISHLFNEFATEDVAQLYLHSNMPQSQKFNKFYHISDFDMLKSCLGKESHGSTEQAMQGDESVNKNVKKKHSLKDLLYSIGSRKNAFINLLRDSIWKEKHWKNDNLIKWIDDFSPQAIFYASGESSFSFKIAMNIARTYNIPLITYFCDDYYFYSRKTISPIYRIYINKLRRNINNIIDFSSELVFISQSMKNTYKQEFKKSGHVIMTPANIEPVASSQKLKDRKVIMSYLGNISLRMSPLIEIGNTISNHYKEDIEFNLYTAEQRSKNIKKILSCKGINFKGSILSNQVDKVMLESDVLVHVESFDEDTKRLVKHSTSTKIPHILGMGKCMFAYGPKDVASINYLEENNCALVCTSKEKLKNTLKTLCDGSVSYEKPNEKAIETAKENHSLKDNSLKLKEILDGAE